MIKLYSTVLHKDQSSEQLFASLQERDTGTLAFLYDKYSPALYGTILNKVPSKQIASDILTKTFITIWQDCVTTGCINQSIFSWMSSIVNSTTKIELSKPQPEKSIIVEKVA